MLSPLERAAQYIKSLGPILDDETAEWIYEDMCHELSKRFDPLMCRAVMAYQRMRDENRKLHTVLENGMKLSRDRRRMEIASVVMDMMKYVFEKSPAEAAEESAAKEQA